MKKPFIFLLVILILAVFGVIYASLFITPSELKRKEVREELVRLQGRWALVSEEVGERKRTYDAEWTEHGLEVKGESLTEIVCGGMKFDSLFCLNPRETPKAIDIVTGQFAEKAVYEINGTTLTIGRNFSGTKRPSALTAGDDVVLLTYRFVFPCQ